MDIGLMADGYHRKKSDLVMVLGRTLTCGPHGCQVIFHVTGPICHPEMEYHA